MRRFVFAVALSVFVSTFSFAGHNETFAGRLSSYAGAHKAHRAFMTHEFTLKSHKNELTAQNYVQYFVDREYVNKIMEARFQSTLGIDPSADLNDLAVEKKFFFRSLNNRAALEVLRKMPDGDSLLNSIQPSIAAQTYGELLRNGREDIVATHYVLFLIGETHGLQATAFHANRTFPGMIDALKMGGDIELEDIRTIFITWANERLNPTDEAEYKLAAEQVLRAFTKIAEAALGKDSAITTLIAPLESEPAASSTPTGQASDSIWGSGSSFWDFLDIAWGND